MWDGISYDMLEYILMTLYHIHCKIRFAKHILNVFKPYIFCFIWKLHGAIWDIRWRAAKALDEGCGWGPHRRILSKASTSNCQMKAISWWLERQRLLHRWLHDDRADRLVMQGDDMHWRFLVAESQRACRWMLSADDTWELVAFA